MLGMSMGSDWRYLVRHAEEGLPAADEAPARTDNYYLSSASHGEPPGLWWGKGSESLGLTGEVSHADMDTVYGALRHPETRDRLGREPRRYASLDERIARLVAGEQGEVTPERRSELE